MYSFLFQKNKAKKTGFTLIEIMVSVSIFAIVVTIAMGAIFTIVDTNRKAQSLKAVMSNLNFALENMTRTIKTGSLYQVTGNCNSTVTNNTLTVQNAIVSGTSGHQVVYTLGGTTGNQITKQVDTASPLEVTAPEITIQNLCFYVTGNGVSADNAQPRVTVILKGYAGVNEKTKSFFNLQTTISQRLLDS